MDSTALEVLRLIKENNIGFIRLCFCDLLGIKKTIAIMAEELESAFTNGISFDAHAIKGFNKVTDSDLLLFPDPASLTILPSESVASFYCDIKNPNKSTFLSDARALLKKVIFRADAMGYVCKVGAECEFYLFKLDEEGYPTLRTIDEGGYLDTSPLDKGEGIRREICSSLSQMCIYPEISHHEQGAGQNEISFRFNNALETADNFLTFKSVVKSIALKNNLFASFMPKPILNAPGSGLHINLSLNQNGRNIFMDESTRSSFIAGILSKSVDMTLFLNPIVNSYFRLGQFEAPRYASWSLSNRSQLIRIPVASGDKTRMELRSPDCSVNPYLAFALIISAGLDGIENKLTLSNPINEDLFTANKEITDKLDRLPDSLNQAIISAKKSEFIRNVINENMLNSFISLKEKEAQEFLNETDLQQLCIKKYFHIL